jgi:hypothetical protein
MVALIDLIDFDLLGLFLKVEVLVILLFFYLVLSKPCFGFIRDNLGVDKNGKLFRMFMVAHNMLLCIFSGWVMVNSWPMMIRYTWEHGLSALFKDPQFWNEVGFGKWAIVFYVSKYYEFWDTWILVLKGTKPSFLQVYHHTGILISMYLSCVCQSNYLVIVVTFNSMIHTIMYFYYIFSCLGYKSSFASTLTMMQLAQFLVGITISSWSYFLDDVSMNSKLTLAFLHIYAIGLIYLFGEMYKQKYTRKPVLQKKKE